VNGGSARSIGVPDACLLMTVIQTIACVVQSRTKHVLITRNGLKDMAIATHGRQSHIICDDALLLSWATFFASDAQQGQCLLLP